MADLLPLGKAEDQHIVGEKFAYSPKIIFLFMSQHAKDLCLESVPCRLEQETTEFAIYLVSAFRITTYLWGW